MVMCSICSALAISTVCIVLFAGEGIYHCSEILGKDEVDEQSYRLIQQKYDELLPQAREVLLMDTLGTRQGHVGKISQCQSAGKTFSW